ncbi:hypothetical protein BHF71_05875 [Vulcanibacillus modesticaldus]|uniref:Phosphatidic acid phosphatase type 2/haloperoxidase domain-containing protein n=1 Tax=Vulcanibacillus modesticaldus TaxID=337097 RepID=A0A1D2YWY2_9BACI|nr:phosphatase PAP2 family protein [Vulcanibacillus modesticaldus]OEG00214.1 hypothetical protein BHF71_05875 [Vulcanibacillus modesticaldus]
MFSSMKIIILSVMFLSFIIPSFILRKNPFTVSKIAFGKLITDRKMLLHFTALFLILYFNKIEQRFSKDLSVGDYTPIIRQWEGDTVYLIQQFFMNDNLTYILTLFYITIFPTLMVSSVIIYLNDNDLKSFYSFVYALMLNYGLAIPFFLFFPVFEVWHHNPDVQFLIPQVYPNFEIEYRPLSGIDNNFPSLHTSISVSMALIALQSKNRLFGKVTLIASVFILFSTIYLGIHWLSDMTAGILLGIIASQTGLRIAERTVEEEQFSL